MNWMTLLGLAGFFQGLCNFSFRQMSVATNSAYALAGFFVLAGAMFAGYAMSIRDPDLNRTGWMWVGILAVTIFASNILLMRGFNLGAPTGIGYLMFSVFSLATVVILGMVVLGEKLNVYGWVGVALAAAAIVLLANGKAV